MVQSSKNTHAAKKSPGVLHLSLGLDFGPEQAETIFSLQDHTGRFTIVKELTPRALEILSAFRGELVKVTSELLRELEAIPSQPLREMCQTHLESQVKSVAKPTK